MHLQHDAPSPHTANPSAPAQGLPSLIRAFGLESDPKKMMQHASARASVVIATLNDAQHIGTLVRAALDDPLTGEVIVVDDCSTDDTMALAQAAGARAQRSALLGKGASMADGVRAAQFPFIVFLDGALQSIGAKTISALTLPLMQGRADCVSARYAHEATRIGELTVRPMLRIFFPELAHFSQPMGGVFAVRRDAVTPLRLEDGCAAELALLIDVHRAGKRVGEVDIAPAQPSVQPLSNLGAVAQEVTRVVFERARSEGRLSAEHISTMAEIERRHHNEMDFVFSRIADAHNVVLVNMDDAVLTTPFIDTLASICGRSAELAAIRRRPWSNPAMLHERVSQLFKGVHQAAFERVARETPLRDGVIEAVNRLRRKGVVVGVLSEAYFVASDIVRRRVFADFTLANSVNFEKKICVGGFELNRAFRPPNARTVAADVCLGNVVKQMRAVHATASLRAQTISAVGDTLASGGLMRAADHAYPLDFLRVRELPKRKPTSLEAFLAIERQLAEMPMERAA